MKNKIIWIVVLVVVAGGALYGGMYLQKRKGITAASLQSLSTDQRRQLLQQLAQNGGFGGGARNRAGGANGGGFTGGQIIAKDDKSITIQLPNNAGTRIVFISGNSQVMKSVAGSVSDLSVGEQVTVTGSSNSDGSVTAQNIQIRPAGQMGMGQNRPYGN